MSRLNQEALERDQLVLRTVLSKYDCDEPVSEHGELSWWNWLVKVAFVHNSKELLQELLVLERMRTNYVVQRYATNAVSSSLKAWETVRDTFGEFPEGCEYLPMLQQAYVGHLAKLKEIEQKIVKQHDTVLARYDDVLAALAKTKNKEKETNDTQEKHDNARGAE
jgi:hypothetical protein